VVNGLGLIVMLVLVAARGWPIAAFALAGFVLSVGYTAPPLRLKKHGLGEVTVIAVWGPLMMGGTYYAATGSVPWQVYVASLPYAILSTTVLMGKHIDKLAWDERDGTRTLPVVLGEERARLATKAMFVTFYVLTAVLVAVRIFPVAALLVFASFQLFPRVWQAYGHPKPAESPVPNPVWPLWFAPLAFLLTRRAGGLLVLGLIIGALLGW
jgi:1,4-dihydroxy-2-naphthoate octaprenyltransferase